MDRIKVQHQGFEITYAENEDVWRCWNLDLEASTLSKAKTKINEHIRNSIKNADLVFGLLDWGRVTKVQLVSRDSSSGKFWVLTPDGRRRKEPLDKLVHWTDDLVETLEEAENLDKQASALNKQASELRKAIKPMEQDDLDKLVADLSKRIGTDE